MLDTIRIPSLWRRRGREGNEENEGRKETGEGGKEGEIVGGSTAVFEHTRGRFGDLQQGESHVDLWEG